MKILKVFLETLVNEGLLDGIEGYYPYYSQEQQKFALEFAKEHNLYISGGSDSHGTPDSEIGIGREKFKYTRKNYISLD